MKALTDILQGFRPITSELFRIVRTEETPCVAMNPHKLHIDVTAGCSAEVVLVHGEAVESSLRITLGEDARLTLVEVFTAEAFVDMALTQKIRSQYRMTCVELSSANLSCVLNLDGQGAENEFGGVFLAAGEEHCVVRLRTNHDVPDCRSNSVVKGVASGKAVGEFAGLVYVAPDAQRTDARQTSRNVLLSETARITTQPQLEIYADDVKCSHGATVGQMDSEAIYYMRQRGLSEREAHRLQIEGFVGDVVGHCGIEGLCESLMALTIAKLEKL